MAGGEGVILRSSASSAKSVFPKISCGKGREG